MKQTAILADEMETTKSCTEPGSYSTAGPSAEEDVWKGPTWGETVQSFRTETASRKGQRLNFCYISRYKLTVSHPSYHRLCVPCGRLNIAGSNLSLPNALNLQGKVALITGARVNLGYHTALRVLRCGGSVIATTRYPQDAVQRYSIKPDFDLWKGRLRVIGAGFRHARDAIDLVSCTKKILRKWDCGLDILITNATQTSTDTVDEERKVLQNEKKLLLTGSRSSTLVRGNMYKARIRGERGPFERRFLR
ncbi:hypothetical protein M501DRAFT_681142 [Patellaria atrata CBS 101060]|uniref:Uncharacterized protein n=1 Tax=Patellaria atrata CBS 101060 TaxID=1346257 RepID=A0A9P4SEA6_9PEZI|nr:hypothetical protein M501DRAFT_681142 [Patellaria atrata CBS 101060]